MAVAAGCGRPLGEPQMEPSVSYLATACDLSYIHIYRLLSTHSAPESSFWCLVGNCGGRGGQLIYRAGVGFLLKIWSSPVGNNGCHAVLHIHSVHQWSWNEFVFSLVSLSTYLSVCVFISKISQRVTNRFSWYVVDRTLSAKITLFTLSYEPDLVLLLLKELFI